METTSLDTTLEAAEQRLEVLKKLSNYPALSSTIVLHDLLRLFAQSYLTEPQQAHVKRILVLHTECMLNQ